MRGSMRVFKKGYIAFLLILPSGEWHTVNGDLVIIRAPNPLTVSCNRMVRLTTMVVVRMASRAVQC
jgi:hypothetical protein